ncbi:MAG: hypothetical protein QCH35_03285 [Methanomicrobiaceae archaeon]|nr:hypothetical protein [Methanomicrobiaceae archaeon]
MRNGRVNDPWLEHLLHRPDVQARVQIVILLAQLSSLAGLAAGVLLLVVYCAFPG